jgi:hypothetical protein
MKKYNLFLDDRRTLDMAYEANSGLKIHLSKHPILIAKNASEFISIVLKNGIPKMVSFDHDLGDFYYDNGEKRERSGATCAEWLCKYCMQSGKPLPHFSVHSDNPVGRESIKKIFKFYAKYI